MDPRKIDITNKAHLELLIDEIEDASNKDRKAEAWKLFEVYEDNQRPYVINTLAAIYPDTFEKFRVGDINIAGKILTKKSKAYKSTPKRSLDNDNETELYSDILEDSKADRAYKEFDKIYNAHKYSNLWVNYINPKEDDPRDMGKYVFNSLAPYEYDLLRDPLTGEALVFILHYPDTTITGGQDGIEQAITESQKDTAAESKIYSLWSKDFKVKIRFTRTIIGESYKNNVEITEVLPNEINRLPCAFLSKDLAVDYPLPSQLANKAIDWNVGLSDLKTASSAQGHGQLVIEHPTGQAIEKPHLGKHTAILLPQSKKAEDKPTKAMYINASPDLNGQLDVLKFDLINIMDDEGIQAKGAIEGGMDNVKSGFDRLLKEADVQDIVENNQSLYADIEQEVYEIVKAYEAALGRKTFRSEKLQITFEKPKVMISDAETLANIEKREQLGLLKSHEKHIIINPNLSEADAIARELEIQEEAKKRMKDMQEVMGDDPSVDNEEDNVDNEEDNVE